MAIAHKIRDLIAQTTTGTVRPQVARDGRSHEVAGAAWKAVAPMKALAR